MATGPQAMEPRVVDADPIGEGGVVTFDADHILDHLPVATMVTGPDGAIMWVNATVHQVFGYEPDELVGTNLLDHIDVSWNPLVLESIAYALDHPGIRLPMLYRVIPKHGRGLIVEVTANNQIDNPDIGGLVAQLRVWEEQHLLDQVLESMGGDLPLLHTLRLLTAVAADQTLRADAAVYGMDSHRPALLWSQPEQLPLAAIGPWDRAAATNEPVVVAVDELPAGPLRDGATAAGHQACWAFPIHRQGTDAEVIGVLTLWRHEPGPPEPTAQMMVHRLVQFASLAMTRAAHLDQLLHAARHDPLTDLPNRDLFFTALDRSLADADQRIGVLYLDLDGFKQVNDEHGHAAGDLVLVAVATRILAALEPDHLAARLGGDEFAILCPGADDERLATLAELLVDLIGRPIEGPPLLQVGVTIGVSIAEPATATGDVLVDRADAALLAAKSEAKGTVRFA